MIKFWGVEKKIYIHTLLKMGKAVVSLFLLNSTTLFLFCVSVTVDNKMLQLGYHLDIIISWGWKESFD